MMTNDVDWPTEYLDSGHEARQRVDQVGSQLPLASLVQYSEIIPNIIIILWHKSGKIPPVSVNYPTQFNSHRFDIIIFLRAERITKLIGTAKERRRRRKSIFHFVNLPSLKIILKSWKTLRLRLRILTKVLNVPESRVEPPKHLTAHLLLRPRFDTFPLPWIASSICPREWPKGIIAKAIAIQLTLIYSPSLKLQMLK